MRVLLAKPIFFFFTKGEPTNDVWYYDLSDLNITKKQQLTVEHFEEFFKLLNPSTLELREGDRSWRVSIEEIKAKNYDIKAVNPNRKDKEDSRSPDELIGIIESQTNEITKVVEILRNKGV